MPGHQFTE